MERNEIKMKLSIILTLALIGCGTDSKDTPVTTATTETAVETPEVVTPTETAPDYFATVQAAARGLVKGQTMAAIDATALANLSLDEDTSAGSKAYYKGLNRVTFWICKGTTTVQAYTIKSEAKVLLYTSCADVLQPLAAAAVLRDNWSSKLTTEQLAYSNAIKTTETDGLNGNPPKYYKVTLTRFTGTTMDYYYAIDICENGKVFAVFNGSVTPTVLTRDTAICN